MKPSSFPLTDHEGITMLGQQQPNTDDLALLARVAAGEFDFVAVAPDTLKRLVALGLVAPVPVLTFPVIPTQFEYRLTLCGLRALNDNLAGPKGKTHPQ